MSNITKEWLLKTIAELEEERDAVPAVVNEDAANALAAMKLALASLEAEPVAYIIQDADARSRGEKGILRYFANISDEDINEYQITVTPLCTAQPTAVSVPDAISTRQAIAKMENHELCDSINVAYKFGWNACRAAMIKGAEPVTTANKLRDAVETIRNSGIEIDAEKIFAERDALNAPDCWCRTCRPITLTDMRFVVCPGCGNKRCPHANDHRNACTGSNDPGQEGSAYPAAPQQEVK